MELSKIVQEGLDDINKIFGDKAEIKFILNKKGFVNEFLSSQIKLLEAELERKKGMIINEYPPADMIGVDYKLIYAEDRGYNQAINQDISYLQDQITKCKELMK